jgi:hypothetical protein
LALSPASLIVSRRLQNAKSRINTAFFVAKTKYLLTAYGKIELRKTINQPPKGDILI